MPTLTVDLVEKKVFNTLSEKEEEIDAVALTELLSSIMFSMDWKIVLYNSDDKFTIRSDAIYMVRRNGKFITLYLNNGKSVVLNLNEGTLELQ